MKKFWKIGNWGLYGILVFLGIGQLPSAIGAMCLLASVFAAPEKLRNWVFESRFQRIGLLLACLFFIWSLPAEEFSIAGRCLGRLLYAVYQWFGAVWK